MKEVMCMLLCLLLAFSCLGCGSVKIENMADATSSMGNTEASSAESSAPTVKKASAAAAKPSSQAVEEVDSGRIFSRSGLELPEVGLYTTKAVKLSGTEILLLCTDGEKKPRFITYNLPDGAMTPMSLETDKKIVDIDSDMNGSFCALCESADGTYYILACSPEKAVKEIPIKGNVTEYDAYWSVCCCGDSFLVDGGNDVFLLDCNGDKITSYGPY